MSYNPFNSQLIPSGYDLTLLDRETDFMDLESKCSGDRILNYRYISPRGMGKTTLLESFFSFDRCQELAQNRKQLVCICRFSGDDMKTDAEVFVRLIEAVKDSLDNLDMDSPDYEKLSEGLRQKENARPDYKDDPNKGEALLKEMLNYLRSRRYFVTLVLDEFHQLACAGNLADTTFSKMAAIGQKKLISYIVASDYDDEVGSASYYISPFSRIFANCTTHLEGITSRAGRKALVDLIRSKLSRCPDIVFTDEELKHLIALTGGIPGVMQLVLKDLFEIKQKMNRELDLDALTKYALSACTPLMEKWVQYFDDARWETMSAVIRYVSEQEVKKHLPQEEDNLTSLTESGLVTKIVHTQEYHPVCPLFAKYVQAELPRRTREKEIAKPQETPHVENHYHFAEGTKFIQGDDHSQTLNAQNVQIQNGLSVSDVLQILGDSQGDTRELFAARLSEQLRRYIPANGLDVLPREAFDSEAAYLQSYDEAFSAMSSKVVQDVEVDEDMELVVTPAELQTLDERFEDARRRCRPDLTDQILEAQEDRCRFYLKLSVVVEDALNLPGIQMEDYSPQLVLYGKALEQALRDRFFNLFKSDPVLGAEETTRRDRVTRKLLKFSEVEESDTYIGTYTFILRKHKGYLANLCSDHPVQLSGTPTDQVDWSDWWHHLQNDADIARNIRNRADHADKVSPGRDSLNQMYDMLIGTDTTAGILPRILIGSRLHRSLVPPVFTMEVVQKFKGQVCQILCTKVKENGGITGQILDEGYTVKVSPKRVAAYRNASGCGDEDLTGKQLTVRVLEHKDQHEQEFFTAELIVATQDEI